MKHRTLRIAWSAVCSILGVLLIVLWMHSQRWHMHFYPGLQLGVDCWSGWLWIYTIPTPGSPNHGINFPCWLLVAATVALAVLPWARHYSLRALLIATTLIAAVLGIAAALNRLQM